MFRDYGQEKITFNAFLSRLGKCTRLFRFSSQTIRYLFQDNTSLTKLDPPLKNCLKTVTADTHLEQIGQLSVNVSLIVRQ